MTSRIGCAVLAAGAARRFGGPKLLVELEGRTLLTRALEAARGSRCESVAVVLGAHAERLGDTLIHERVERVRNVEWEEGMASSIRAATAWARARGFDALVLVAADQPRLQAEHVDALIAASDEARRMAASQYGGLLGVPALFPRGSFEALEALTGDVGARSILRRADARVASVPWPAGALDVDRPGDMAGW
jgi:CTP:molybdopterin cytidylyltransferase MocA